MAKNVGLLQFEGAIGDVVSYKRYGKRIVQRKGGFDGERMKVEDRYEPVRKRQSEFGKCAKLSSSIKRALDVWLDYVPEVMLYNHIQSVVMGVKNCDVLSEKGAKTFEKGLKTPAGTALFRKFQLHPKRSLSAGTVVVAPFNFETGMVSITPHHYKLKSRMSLGVELLLLQIDLETYDYTLVSSGVQYSDALHQTIDLQVSVPQEAVFMAAFLFVGKCDKVGKSYIWMRDVETGFGLLDFKLA